MTKKLLSLTAAVLGFLSLSFNDLPIKREEPKYILEARAKYGSLIKEAPFCQTEEMKQLEKKLYQLSNYEVSNFSEDSDKNLLARLILGEAADCSEIEKIAVAYSAINRAKRGKSLKEVILEPYQYSCFNEGSDSSKFLKNPMAYDSKEFIECLNLARDILSGKYSDPTGGATHYFNPKIVKTPSWAKNLKKIGRIKNSYHIFYK